MDRIYIDDLKIFAHHGVFSSENIKGQNFYVNVTLFLDTEKAGTEDDLSLTVNYAEIRALIEKTMTENTYKLIETAAHAAAAAILRSSSLISEVEIEIRKPEAPIDAQVRSVSVKIGRSRHTAVIALGSNIGDSRELINSAVEKIKSSPFFWDIHVSDMMITKPYGYTDQPDFLNGVLVCSTMLSPIGLLDLMQSIENSAGRTREIHWGPRTLDLDLIFYDDEIISCERLTVPHPDMHNRRFVLEPAAQLVPGYVHPVLKKTVAELLRELDE